METRKLGLVIFVLVLICFAMVACSEGGGHDEDVIMVSPISTKEFVQTETRRAEDTPATSTPMLAKTSTQTINPTMSVIPSPSRVIMATKVPGFTNRQPSIEELETYQTDLDLYIEPGYYGHVLETIYEDVNDDGEDDLIVSDYMFVGVFLWRADHYEGSFIYQGDPWKYDPGSRVTLEDWTNDGVPEIVFDYREDTGGTGARVTDWECYLIHCFDDYTCRVIWVGEMGALSEAYGSGRVSLMRANIEHSMDSETNPILEYSSETFAVFNSSTLPFTYPIDDGILSYDSGRPLEKIPDYSTWESLKVYTSSLEIFIWNGNQYKWQETKVVSPLKTIDSQAALEATGEGGINATIAYERFDDATFDVDVCQLLVNGKETGPEFGCEHNFSQLEWLDVTGDDEEELIIRGYAGFLLDEEGAWEKNPHDKECSVKQLMIILQWDQSELEAIADITGCVVESDLYGVRFEDIDFDGQTEILAANGMFTESRCSSRFSTAGLEEKQENCWYELGYQNEVYKWNGSEFVFSGLLNE